ncbi:hypothetical protein EON78_03585 [bacterium]|nr:MAG: hypothetical protein EON78_03585 [bacterium]
MNASPNNGRFIAMPTILKELQNKTIKYIDALTYTSIRSFNNGRNNECYPAYETIAERAGMCRSSVCASVKRLENAGLLKIKRSTKKHTCNQYDFRDKLAYFEKIPYGIFECDLTAYEKAMLICLRPLFVEGFLQCSMTIKKLAENLGVTYRTVHAQFKSLVLKGYINEKHISYGSKNKGSVRLYLTEKLNWIYEYTKPTTVNKNKSVFELKVA